MAKQDRLFDPGPKSPNRWALHPDNWVKRPDVVYHASRDASLPRKDRGAGKNVEYGKSTGMHFGNKEAAYDRASTADPRENIHTARLNGDLFHHKEWSDGAWTDEEANYSDKADAAVKAGKVVPYRNNFEGTGSISYRAKAESVRTWSEDVKSDPNAHPALQHLADKGYNPMLKRSEMVSHARSFHEMVSGPPQQELFPADLTQNGKAIAHGSEDEMFARFKDMPRGSGTGVMRRMQRGSYTEAAAVQAAKPKLRPSR